MELSELAYKLAPFLSRLVATDASGISTHAGLPDSHHTAFIGLKDDASASVSPGGDDLIQLVGGTGITTTAGTNQVTIEIEDPLTATSLTLTGSAGLTLSGSAAGITFSGTGNHDITASSGTLRLGATTLTGAVVGNSQTLTGLAQLTVDNLDLDGNTIQAASGGITLDKGAGTVTIFRSTNSGTPSTAADDFVIESGDASTNVGMTIMIGTSSLGQIAFGHASDSNAALVRYSSADDTMSIGTATASGTLRFYTANLSEAMRIDAAGNVMIGDTTPSASGPSLVVNQGSSDDELFQGRSSDVAHGMTGEATTETYYVNKKINPNYGGAEVHGLLESGGSISSALLLRGSHGGTADTTKSSSGEGVIMLDSREKSGTGTTAVGTNGNLVVIQNDGSARAIFDEAGELHLDAGVTSNAWDHYDDVALLTGLRASVMQNPSQAFAKFIDYARPVLERDGVVTYNKDGRHFFALKKLLMLMIDTIRQLAGRITANRQRADEIETRLRNLETIVYESGMEL